MARNFDACFKAASGNIITARGRLRYAHLWKPSAMKDEKDMEKARYQTTLIFPKHADLTVLLQAVEAAKVEKWGADYKKSGKVRATFYRVEDYPKLGVDPEEYEAFIRTKNKERPGVVRADNTKVDEMDANEAYEGRWACVSVRPFAYTHETGRGVTLLLQNVQLLDHDDVLAGSRVAAEDEFESAPAVAGGKAATSDDLYG